MPIDETKPGGDGVLLNQVLQELAALRRELAEVKSSLAGSAGGEGIYESTRALKRDFVEMRARVVLLESTLAQMKDAPTRVIGGWFNQAIPGLIVALVLGLAGLCWIAIGQNHAAPAAVIVPAVK